jgi:fascin 1/2
MPVFIDAGHNDRYLTIDPDDGGLVAADTVDPQPFLLELGGRSRLAVRAPNGNYLAGQQNGLITSKSSDIEQATWWEY